MATITLKNSARRFSLFELGLFRACVLILVVAGTSTAHATERRTVAEYQATPIPCDLIVEHSKNSDAIKNEERVKCKAARVSSKPPTHLVVPSHEDPLAHCHAEKNDRTPKAVNLEEVARCIRKQKTDLSASEKSALKISPVNQR